ncbi:hypothetical protein Gotri_003931 [Gossypium trilobum]|uniref:Vesicle transport protein n=3 Tax=Gossypium TaxID=3633 RepID=A0A7J9F342_9ROSI|nr:hypothetical protein [Gossypium trilobum]
MEKMNNAFEKMKMLVGMEVEDEHQQPAIEEDGNSFSFMDDFNRQCTLTTKQRFYGFAICLVSGLTCTLLSILVFFHPIKFGITFTFGNLLALGRFQMLSWSLLYGSTAFLIGPKRQVSMMLDPVRIYATAIYLASMIIALFCAFYVRNKLLTLLAIMLEFGALIWYVELNSLLIAFKCYHIAKELWYSLSYIPFARSMVSKIMVSCFDTEF